LILAFSSLSVFTNHIKAIFYEISTMSKWNRINGRLVSADDLSDVYVAASEERSISVLGGTLTLVSSSAYTDVYIWDGSFEAGREVSALMDACAVGAEKYRKIGRARRTRAFEKALQEAFSDRQVSA
jgi:hypothetical protein